MQVFIPELKNLTIIRKICSYIYLKLISVKRALIIVLLLVPVLAFSQVKKPKNLVNYDKKKIHWGFTLGLNAMDFILYPSQSAYMVDSLYPEVTPIFPGFNINVVSSLTLHKHLTLRFLPGISFGQRTIYYYKNQVNGDSTGLNRILLDTDQKIESSFLEFPLIFKYKADRINNWRPYVIGGVNLRVDLSAKKKYDEDKPVNLRLNRTDLYYEVGFGFDFFLKYFKFSPELKLSVGTRDMLVHEPRDGRPEYGQYVNSIDKLKSMMWILSFHFE